MGQHFGITTFGINAMTARPDGDRLITEHDEAQPDSGEELYVVMSGHATFDDPPYGAVYYNTACFEARAGRTDAALAHLRRAVELSPHLAELARTDDDLAALREQAGFAEIVGA